MTSTDPDTVFREIAVFAASVKATLADHQRDLDAIGSELARWIERIRRMQLPPTTPEPTTTFACGEGGMSETQAWAQVQHEPQEVVCKTCNGAGRTPCALHRSGHECEACNGTGMVVPLAS